MKLMHEVTHFTFDVRHILRTSQNKKQVCDDSAFTIPSFGLKENFKEVYDFAELNSKMTNSRQTSNQVNSLQWQVSSLQQRLASYDKSFSDLLSYNWLFPKGAIQGISGYVCKKCQTFSLKAIIDIGYDMTMERKHRCIDSPDKRSYIVLPIPSDIPIVDDWAAQCLLDQVNFYIPIGKYLIANDITEGLINFSNKLNLNPEVVMGIVGIPDKYPFYSFKNNYKTNWIDRTIDNIGKKMLIPDDEVLDFFRKVKSTYAIFEIPIGESLRQFFMYFTNY
jgi:hypothetical protein